MKKEEKVPPEPELVILREEIRLEAVGCARESPLSSFDYPLEQLKEWSLHSQMPPEEIIVPDETEDGGVVYRQKDLVKETDRWSLKDRQDFETKMDEALQDGDLDDIKELITPNNLTRCVTNCLEKSFEVSYKLKQLANSKGPDAEDLESLATSVEDFAVQLLEPLKSDDLKRAIFKGEDFDRVSDKAVKYRQKKFVSHPVTYTVLRQRWTGHFHHLKYSSGKRNWLKWVLLNFWTFFDVFLFPVAYGLLSVIHLITKSVKKRQVLRVAFLFNASWKYAARQFQTMRGISSYIMNNLQYDRVEYATITRDHNGPIISKFTSSEEATTEMNSKKDVQHPTREKEDGNDKKDDKVFLNYLKEVENLFEDAEEGSNKVLVVMTDDKFGTPSKELLKAARSLKQRKIKVISVGLGVHPEIKELETMATDAKNTFLIFSRQSDEKQDKECDYILQYHYVEYFTTPYFIFFRDTLTYLALLGLHFAMCLQPSTIHFTAIEWIIMLFFLGRFMMEINQVVMERNSAWTERNEFLEDNDEVTSETSNGEGTPTIFAHEDEPKKRMKTLKKKGTKTRSHRSGRN